MKQTTAADDSYLTCSISPTPLLYLTSAVAVTLDLMTKDQTSSKPAMSQRVSDIFSVSVNVKIFYMKTQQGLCR